jgi:hypothetical protein
VGQNWCLNPQAACPRLPGEGYLKCKTVCPQPGMQKRWPWPWPVSAKGATAYVEGHTYACDNCQSVLKKAGVIRIEIASPPIK